MKTNEKYLEILSNKLKSAFSRFESIRILCMIVRIKPEDYYKGENMFEYQVFYTVSHDKTLRENIFTGEYFLENNEDYLILDYNYEEKDIMFEGICYTILDYNLEHYKDYEYTMFIIKKNNGMLGFRWFKHGEYFVSHTRKNLELFDKL